MRGTLFQIKDPVPAIVKTIRHPLTWLAERNHGYEKEIGSVTASEKKR